MTNLRPYDNSPPRTPLSGGARFIRGFTRIGAVVAVLVALIGGTITVIIAVDKFNSAVSARKSAICVAQLARTGYTFKKKEYSNDLNYDAGGCAGWYFSYTPLKDILAIADAPEPTFVTSDSAPALGIGLIVTGLCAIAIYFAFWCVGWVFAGFTRDA